MAAPGALVVAGTHSGVGKTTITLALLAALRKRSLRVQPFKVGPDFIDPGHHRSAVGAPSHNLDSWMLDPAVLISIYCRHAAQADVSVIEGVMGLFDGSSGQSEEGSTAEVAKLIGAPVLLVVDAGSMARSGAAVVYGFEQFDAALDVVGVIFNRVAGEGHYRYLREAVGARCRAISLGFLPHDASLEIPERHLGLVTSVEHSLTPEFLDRLASAIEAHVDVDRLLELAQRSAPRHLPAGQADELEAEMRSPRPVTQPGAMPRIGVAFDRAFCFYYEENLELLRRLGAELVFFSPIDDAALPSGLQGLYLGGGYPELFAARLEANSDMRNAVAGFARAGRPVYAECGGFMYLTRAIIVEEGTGPQREYAMTGVYPSRIRMRSRLCAIGYVEVEQLAGTILAPPGMRIRGHEFHYSELLDMPESVPRAYTLRNSRQSEPRFEGYQMKQTLAGYLHLHFGSNPEFARGFVASCAAMTA